MPKTRYFNVKITIYPELFEDDNFDYIKDVLNTWVEENYIAHIDNFTIIVEQISGIAQFYTYDRLEATEDMNVEGLWNNTGGRYNIFISGEGKVLNACLKKVIPPTALIDFGMDLIDFRYMSIQDQEAQGLTFGKTIGFPREYSSANVDAEDWSSKIQDEKNVYTHDMNIELTCSKDTITQAKIILEEFKTLSLSKKGFNIIIDDEEITLGYSDFGSIKVSGNYVLKSENKTAFLKCLNNS